MQKFDVFWFSVEKKFLLYEMAGGWRPLTLLKKLY